MDGLILRDTDETLTCSNVDLQSGQGLPSVLLIMCLPKRQGASVSQQLTSVPPMAALVLTSQPFVQADNLPLLLFLGPCLFLSRAFLGTELVTVTNMGSTSTGPFYSLQQ